MNSPSAEIWVLQSQKPGDNNQSIALANALGRPYVVKHLDWPAAKSEERGLSQALLADTSEAAGRRARLGLAQPWPLAVICCGRRAERFALWIKATSGGRSKVIRIGRAARSLQRYDLLIATPQFPAPLLANVIQLDFPPTLEADRGPPSDDAAFSRLPGDLAVLPKPWFAILLGGEVKQFAPSAKALENAARKVQDAADRAGGSVVISTSRRTPEKMLSAIMKGLGRTPYIYRWSADKLDENPYPTLLRESAAVFVTADSISMMMDACRAGTPTFVIELPVRRGAGRRWELITYKSLTALARWSGTVAGSGARECIYRAQDWLHRRRIARFPKDISRLHVSLYSSGLAHPMRAFDPSVIPAHSPGVRHPAIAAQVKHVATRCRALLGELPGRESGRAGQQRSTQES